MRLPCKTAEELEGVGFVDALENLGIPTRNRPKLQSKESVDGKVVTPKLTKNVKEVESHVWAVNPPAEEDRMEPVREGIGFTTAEILCAEIETALPDALARVRKVVGWILAQESYVLTGVLFAMNAEPLRKEATGLRKSLADLLAVMSMVSKKESA